MEEEQTRLQRLGDAAKKAAKIGYNSTFGELSNGRIPVLDTMYRTGYEKGYKGDEGKKVFDAKKGYYELGGKRTRKNKKASKKRKTVNRRRKSKKH
jgi:hypothetical protein